MLPSININDEVNIVANRTSEFKEKYFNALDSMWSLYCNGYKEEKELNKELELATDEIRRIQVLCNSVTSDSATYIISEIEGICERALLNK